MSDRRLRPVEEEVDPAQQGKTSKDEGGLGTQVDLVRVEDVWQDEFPHCEKALLDGRGNGDGLDSEVRCRCLGDDGVRHGSNGEVVGEVVRDRQGNGGYKWM